MTILVDTAPLVALCKSRDEKHDSAVRDLRSIVRNEFCVCDSVLSEACFHLPYDNQRRRLRSLLENLGAKSIPVESEMTFRAEVFDWLTKYADHEPDWADACLAVLSGRDRRARVWTYDREFRTTWRRPDGSAIPLAIKSA